MSPRTVSRLLLSACAVVALGTVAVACGSSGSSAAPVQQDGVLKPLSGDDLYLMSCARCHGADRLGKADAPKLDTVRMSSIGDEPLRALIRYGKGRMPGFGGLTDAQVDLLVASLRANG